MISLGQFRRERVYRVKSTFSDGNFCCGSGFFISDQEFLTCFHVVFGKELRNFIEDPIFMTLSGNTAHKKLQKFFKNNIVKLEVGTEKGDWFTGTLKSYDEKYDIAVLEVKNSKEKRICSVDIETKPDYSDNVYFGGYPVRHEYPVDKGPLTVHSGIISSFPITTIGGAKYEHIQINSINLGGNSGAPLFLENSDKVVGIINGNMTWGNDNILFLNPKTNQTERNSFRIPLSIAYATPLKLLRKKVKYLKGLH